MSAMLEWRGDGLDFSVAKRFWSKVDVKGEDECWQWTAYSEGGYGRIRIGAKTPPAHAVAYALANGRIPNGRQINHYCDNPPCVNPAHLYAGTQQQNVQDRVNAGRSNRMTKTTYSDDTVRAIMAMLDGGATLSQASKRHGMSMSQISRIRRGINRSEA